jgi:phospholipase A-2-activating protein
MASPAPFKLSAQLVGHEADVRAVYFPSPKLVLTASRDHTVRAWRSASLSPPEFEPHIARKGSAYVNAISYLPPSEEYPEGLIASGDHDGLLEVASPTARPSDNAERLLPGHSRNVCTIDVSSDRKWIASGGWDGQTRVWSTEKWDTEVTLDNDGTTAWAVLFLDEHTVATGGIDKKIRVFDLRHQIAGECQPTSVIHTPDVIRSLCRVPDSHPSGATIASATNDFAIRLWTLQGREVGTLEGHESYVYSIAAIPQTGEIVSVGEDRTLRVWNGTECVQTITHPAISVWSVATCGESGDVVTGASDGVARVWTREKNRVADAGVTEAFEESVRASAIPQEQVGGVDPQSLPGPDFLQNKSGTKEGQIQMIRQPDGAVTAHQWSSSEGWVMIGNVVSSAGSSRRKVDYNGQEYDYVFDVALDDGKNFKLPYNVNMNPYDAATKFLADNELPISHLESTAKFIVDNTQGATLGGSSATEDAPRPASPAKAKAKILPQQEYLSLLAAKYDAIVKKILTINATMISTGRKDNALNPTEEGVLRGLQQALEATPQQAVEQTALKLVVRIVTQWPESDRLAGLDLLRCMAPSPVVATYSDSTHGSIVGLTIASGLTGDDEGKVIENCAMMAVRTIANLFVSEQGRKAIANNVADVLRLFNRVLGLTAGTSPIGKSNRNMMMAITTALINLAVLGHKTTVLRSVARGQVIAMTGAVLKEQNDVEVLYRALVALGTLIAAGARADASAAEVVEMRSWVNGAVGRAKVEKRVQDVGAECLAQL